MLGGEFQDVAYSQEHQQQNHRNVQHGDGDLQTVIGPPESADTEQVRCDGEHPYHQPEASTDTGGQADEGGNEGKDQVRENTPDPGDNDRTAEYPLRLG